MSGSRRFVLVSSLLALGTFGADVNADLPRSAQLTIFTGYDLVELSTPAGRSSYCLAISPTGVVAARTSPRARRTRAP